MKKLTETEFIQEIASENWQINTEESSTTYQIWRHKCNKSRLECNLFVDLSGDIQVEIFLYT